MKTLYLECGMGAAGDMLLAALYELDPDRRGALAALNGLGIPQVRYFADPSEKCGILGTHMTVTVYDEEEDSWDSSCMEQVIHEEPHEHAHDHEHTHEHGHPHEHEHTHEHEHHHTGMADIERLLAGLHCSPRVREQVLAVYQLIAQAESEAHGRPVDAIHFHEVGSLDALADVAGVCLMLERLAPDRIVASPVTTGFGQVRCAHGILPVPAPATAFLLRGIPSRAGSIEGELCTPTGAALLRHFAQEFAPMPVMTVESIGYGMGKKDFPAANCVRAMLGEAQGTREEICELRCNLDDMTGEAIAYAEQLLLEAGALDVFLTPIQMKKSRPGVLLTCLCRGEDSARLAEQMLRHTTTLGVRETVCTRTILERSAVSVSTPYGEIPVKVSHRKDILRYKAEYEPTAAAAKAAGIPFAEVAEAAVRAAREKAGR